MIEISSLGQVRDLWEYWGFEPWASAGMKGVYRRVTFVKSGMIGEVCRYYADDYIIWSHNGRGDMRRTLENSRPQPELMTQRYLFVEGADSGEKGRVKSFWLGFRGYAEVHTFTPGGKIGKRVKDLAPLVDTALEILRKKNSGAGGDAIEQ
ncbi:MAG: hypothetical protein ACOX5A_00515 [Aminivibrio sp.]|nr:hypothetical protein [Synergistaceae bacterium]